MVEENSMEKFCHGSRQPKKKTVIFEFQFSLDRERKKKKGVGNCINTDYNFSF